ncbi:hypothetical protein H2200_009664 [Cladophialophora chaetospira]|uniref:Uncharacterized protein n=1 Tax=Cladophialophora chaetospira TaxID=386627 RepID=A0AA38X339_9EURO|nr:hypothetical protein H2200_009664 [Cladophialophora chaetospira]
MMDEEDRPNNDISTEHNKTSKRDRFKGALSRTKSKFKKDNDKPKEEAALPDDVNDFLAAGRTSTSSRASTGETPQRHPTVVTTNEQTSSPVSARPSTSDSFTNSVASQRSPRKLPVPKIDVSTAQRWPRAQPVGLGTAEQDINDFLRPEYQVRSQSASSFSNKPKKKGRGRGLSVSFIEAPPVIIGEGGDNAPTPPLEIGKARQRARSASPMPSRGQVPPEAPNGTYGKRPSPVPPPILQAHAPPDVLRPRGLQRVQTAGFAANAPGASGLDKEFEMTLRMGSNTTSPASAGGSTPNTPDIIAPKPIRVVQPPPAVLEEPTEPHIVKKGLADTNLREKFREGDALRMHLEKESPEVVDEIREGRSLRRHTP